MGEYLDLVETVAYKKLYHVAKNSNLPKIDREGIVPQKKPSWTGAMGQDIRDCKDCIYAFDNKKDAIRWAFKAEWDNKGDKFSIITFDGTGLKWEKDQHWQAQIAEGNWLRAKGKLIPRKIRKIEPMTPALAKSVAQ